MKVLVIGAAGKTGRAVVEQALAAGHLVTAFVLNADGYLPDTKVRVFEGDATDRLAMDSAMLGQDAVIDTIGGKVPYKTTTLEASAAATVIASMQSSGVRRLVVISVFGEGESRANTNFFERLLLSTILRGAVANKAAMESIVDSSSVDWTIVRPPILNDDPGTGNTHVLSAETGEIAHKITRADLAGFLIAQLSSSQYLHKAVTVANS
jgi:putative NADH-flavin reductase